MVPRELISPADVSSRVVGGGRARGDTDPQDVPSSHESTDGRSSTAASLPVPDDRDSPHPHAQGERSPEDNSRVPVSLPPEPVRNYRDSETGFHGIHVRWDPNVDPTFIHTVQEQLELLASKPVGKRLLESIGQSSATTSLSNWQHAKVKIERVGAGTVIDDDPSFMLHAGNVTISTNSNSATTEGKGAPSLVRYNPNAWETADGLRPPFIGLAHELIHVQRNLHGLSNSRTESDEAEVVGFRESSTLEFTENKIRAEHGLAPRSTYTGVVSSEHDESALGPRRIGPSGGPIRAGEIFDAVQFRERNKDALEPGQHELLRTFVGAVIERGQQSARVLTVHVEGGGNGGLLSSGARETGQRRAELVHQEISTLLKSMLPDSMADSVELASPTSRGDGLSDQHASFGRESTDQARREVLLWTESSHGGTSGRELDASVTRGATQEDREPVHVPSARVPTVRTPSGDDGHFTGLLGLDGDSGSAAQGEASQAIGGRASTAVPVGRSGDSASVPPATVPQRERPTVASGDASSAPPCHRRHDEPGPGAGRGSSFCPGADGAPGLSGSSPAHGSNGGEHFTGLVGLDGNSTSATHGETPPHTSDSAASTAPVDRPTITSGDTSSAPPDARTNSEPSAPAVNTTPDTPRHTTPRAGRQRRHRRRTCAPRPGRTWSGRTPRTPPRIRRTRPESSSSSRPLPTPKPTMRCPTVRCPTPRRCTMERTRGLHAGQATRQHARTANRRAPSRGTAA